VVTRLRGACEPGWAGYRQTAARRGTGLATERLGLCRLAPGSRRLAPRSGLWAPDCPGRRRRMGTRAWPRSWRWISCASRYSSCESDNDNPDRPPKVPNHATLMGGPLSLSHISNGGARSRPQLAGEEPAPGLDPGVAEGRMGCGPLPRRRPACTTVAPNLRRSIPAFRTPSGPIARQETGVSRRPMGPPSPLRGEGGRRRRYRSFKASDAVLASGERR
jgi:hypothetical protein